MEAPPGPRLTRALTRLGPLGTFLALWLAQGAIAAGTPLLADEAYYDAWRRWPGLGYLDHPPLIAGWFALAAGHGRALTWLASLAGWGLLADAGRRVGNRDAAWIPALALATPLGFSLCLVITPDAPAFLAWCGVLWGVASGHLWACSLALALALWAKSTVWVALPGLWWALGWRRGAQVLAGAVLLYSPHLWWSWTHEGLPWRFQAGRRFRGGAPVEWLLGQVAVLGPALAWAAVRAWRREVPSAEQTRWRRLVGPTVLGWAALACVTRVEANWAALAWAPLLVWILPQVPSPARLVAQSLAWTAPLALAWAAFAVWGPLGWGPPRDGPALAACLDGLPRGDRRVTARYQEASLLAQVASEPSALGALGHRPAVGHRRSEWDRHPGLPAPACDYWYLARRDRLASCPGPVSASAACGLDLAWCSCPASAARGG